MVEVVEIFAGKKFVICMLVSKGRPLFKDFVNSLEDSEKKKVFALIERTAEEGPPTNEEKFKKVEGEKFFEFKTHQARILCVFEEGGKIILLNGFKKKQRRTPKAEIEKARGLLSLYSRGDER